MKKILTEAVAVGNATARAIVFKSREKDACDYPNSAWFTAFIGGNYEFLSQPGVRDLDARIHFIYYATGITPAMAMKLVGLGSPPSRPHAHHPACWESTTGSLPSGS
jgi:hypothetical protein